jgi:hypothetical protein
MHQKLLTIYLNQKVKYENVRYFIKPLQIYFRDFVRFSLDLSVINYVSRSQLNLVNYNLYSKFTDKLKITKTKKLILNSRIFLIKILKQT